MRLLFILFEMASLATAISKTPHLPSYLTTREAISLNGSDYPVHTIDIPIDHYNATDPRTFSNRYWLNTQHYRPGGPIFYFDAGEQDAAPLVPYFLHEAAGPSAIMALARRFNGLAILFEHRFYGSSAQNGSYPFPINSSTLMLSSEGTAAYAYLTTEQALQDPVYFATHFEPPGLETHWSLLHPSRTPWIWLGGSYPGIRGAQLRVRNPETFFAAWASSAPTEARVDMWTYYAQAERSLARNCSADYTAVTNYVDDVLANGAVGERNALKRQLWRAVHSSTGGQAPSSINTTEADALTNVEVASYLQLPLSFYQYYGFEASVKPFCDIMETFNQTNASTTDNGGTAPAIASESGIASTYNVSAAWEAFLVGIAEIDYDAIPYEPTQGDEISGNSWTWQYCSEYGKSSLSSPKSMQFSRHSGEVAGGLATLQCSRQLTKTSQATTKWATLPTRTPSNPASSLSTTSNPTATPPSPTPYHPHPTPPRPTNTAAGTLTPPTPCSPRANSIPGEPSRPHRRKTTLLTAPQSRTSQRAMSRPPRIRCSGWCTGIWCTCLICARC